MDFINQLVMFLLTVGLFLFMVGLSAFVIAFLIGDDL